jgi:hypothetical protein
LCPLCRRRRQPRPRQRDARAPGPATVAPHAQGARPGPLDVARGDREWGRNTLTETHFCNTRH